jgi:vancomycin resistance protein YoaR
MKPRRALFIAVPIAILLLPLGIYLADQATSPDTIARNVMVSTVPVGGLNPADATVVVAEYEDNLKASTGAFTVNGATFKLNPLEIGLTADVQTAVNAATEARSSGGPVSRFFSWIVSFSKAAEIPLDVSFNDEAIEQVFDAWEDAAVPNPAFNGDVVVVDGAVVPEYPRTGEAIDREFAYTQVVNEMSRLDKTGVVVPVIEQTPKLTDADIDAAAAELDAMIDSEIQLRSADVGFRVIFTPAQLASAAIAEVSKDGSEITATFDPDVVLEILAPRNSEYEIQPINAQLDINVETDAITVIPGRSGTLLDVDGLIAEMKAAALGSGSGNFPLLIGAEPEITTAQAESFTSLKPLGGFTTTHPANQDRVINIHQMANDVDGAIVLPGDTWSLNDYVGERTEAKGYVAAPAIINGEPYCCDHAANIGGGVSQFATTLFNAVFFSCLEDVEHKPHSLYFTRYPIGREATLGVPGPDVKFRNNTDTAVVIKTAYTDGSITVKMYGDNGGLQCTDVTYEPTDVVPYEEQLVADEEGVLTPGERRKERSGIDGFLIRVDRVVTYPDGTTKTDLELSWRYRPLSEQFVVHPCEISGEPLNCPVQLPSLSNKTWSEVLTQLEALGLLAARTDVFVDDPSKDGLVIGQDPASGTWVDAGSTIKVTIGVFDEPDG